MSSVFRLRFDLSGIVIFKNFGVDRNDRLGLLRIKLTQGHCESLIAIQISQLSHGVHKRISIDRFFRSRTTELPEELSP